MRYHKRAFYQLGFGYKETHLNQIEKKKKKITNISYGIEQLIAVINKAKIFFYKTE